MTLHYGIAVHRNADETGTEPLDFRKDVEGLLVRAGAMHRGSDALVAGSAGWTFTLNPAWYATQHAVGDGLQVWGNDGAITLSTNAAGTALPTAAPAAGLSRYYRVWVRHRSNGENSDTTSVPDAGVEFSAASSSPTLPALPTGATEVATNLMDSTATSTASSGNTLVQTMPWTAMRGGVVPLRSSAELTALAALGSDVAPAFGELSGAVYRCGASVSRVTPWVPVTAQYTPGKIASGVTLATLAIPAVPVASKVIVRVAGQAGFDTVDREVGTTIAASAGTLTQPSPTRVLAMNAKWATTAAVAELALPANTSATITIASSADGQAYYRGVATAERYQA